MLRLTTIFASDVSTLYKTVSLLQTPIKDIVVLVDFFPSKIGTDIIKKSLLRRDCQPRNPKVNVFFTDKFIVRKLNYTAF